MALGIGGDNNNEWHRGHSNDSSEVDSAARAANTPSLDIVSEHFQSELAALFPSGLQSQIERRPKIATASEDIAFSDFAPQEAMTIRLVEKLPKVIGFTFPESPLWQGLAKQRTAPSLDSLSDPTLKPTRSSDRKKPKPSKRSITRLKPPSDMVKLEDRLYYLLQPPLETLLGNSEIDFPFEPFPYQFEGVAFLYTRTAAILADEMGLGKTMQAITTMRMLLLAGEVHSICLICPKPLVTNWVRELKLWAPEIPVAIIEGDASKRHFLWRANNIPIKIANYELLMRDAEVVQAETTEFDLVVLDEAQRIKNRSSSTAQIARGIKRRRSWALTGTPIENSSSDLVSIFEFLSPGYLRDEMEIQALSKRSQDYILRRTKDKVLTEMPPKMFRDANLELTHEQAERYKIAEDEGVVQLEDLGQQLTIQHVFELVLRLKQICNFDPVTNASCKLERLEADLEEVAASGQKAIVFSQWVGCLERINERLSRFQPLQYHGKIPSKKRDSVLEEFKSNPNRHVILMSYGAGAVGLNLQFCRYVFLFDRWWNPAIEDQAINRAHRLGAAGSVTVTRMMANHTIEERIHNVLEEKRELFNSLFENGGNPSTTGMSQREIFGLFNLKTPVRSKAA